MAHEQATVTAQAERIIELTKLVAVYKATLAERDEEINYFRQRNASLRVAVNNLSEQVEGLTAANKQLMDSAAEPQRVSLIPEVADALGGAAEPEPIEAAEPLSV